jgi:hypothetical protein
LRFAIRWCIPIDYFGLARNKEQAHVVDRNLGETEAKAHSGLRRWSQQHAAMAIQRQIRRFPERHQAKTGVNIARHRPRSLCGMETVKERHSNLQ